MDLLIPPAALLTLILCSICAAQFINRPFSQAKTPMWKPLAVPKQLRKTYVRSVARDIFDPRLYHQLLEPRNIKLTNYNDTLYYFPIQIGTPGQKFNMAISTNYAAAWVPSVHSASRHALSYPHRRYDNASSSTFMASGMRSRYAQGYWSLDNFIVADIEVQNQSFVEGIRQTNVFKNTDVDGIFGLMPPGVAQVKRPTVFQNMFWQGYLPATAFSLFLNR
ncbi:cathepsin d [Plakobranchus ocellatus]|uniref:Cathepsin d n=1 Tax=Plakobranchus ocellatus TaxID=259542 RepID=A0AAV4BNR5_9GAST|nr:cathepsin d [Plakobranchus ocellatus]